MLITIAGVAMYDPVRCGVKECGDALEIRDGMPAINPATMKEPSLVLLCLACEAEARASNISLTPFGETVNYLRELSRNKKRAALRSLVKVASQD